MSTPATPESGRHTTLQPGDRVRHWQVGYLGRVASILPMDEPLPDYCVVEIDDGTVVTVPHNQLVGPFDLDQRESVVAQS